jgi:acyl carrier protein
VPVKLDLARLRAAEQTPALLRKLVLAGPRKLSVSRREAEQLRERLLRQEPAERSASLLELVLTQVALVLSLPGPNAVDPDRQLQAAGLDSLLAIELRNKLGAQLQIALPPTLAFNYPTPRAISGLLLGKLSTQLATPISSAADMSGTSMTDDDLEALAQWLRLADVSALRAKGIAGIAQQMWRQLERELPQSSAANEHAAIEDTDGLVAFLERKLGAAE